MKKLRQLSPLETEQIFHITDRALDLLAHLDPDVQPNRARIILALCLCHRVLPLDLHMLLTAPDVDFAHDVFGILRHIDKNTGHLRDCFVPRMARFQHVMGAG